MAGLQNGRRRFLIPTASMFLLLASLMRSEAENVGACGVREPVPLVKSVSDLEPFTPSFPGLVHVFVAGVRQHGVKEVEVWMETLAAGSGTPIHRHASEEVLFVLKGKGAVYIQKGVSGDSPGQAEAFPVAANSTARVPSNVVHQLLNDGEEDLQILAVVSQPPMKAYVYEDWSTRHEEAVLIVPFQSEEITTQCLQPGPTIESAYGFVQE